MHCCRPGAGSRNSTGRNARSPWGCPLRARAAACAGLIGEDHMVAGPDTCYVLAGLLHQPRALMPSTASPGPVVAKSYVRVANAGGDDTHERLVVPRAFHLQPWDSAGARPCCSGQPPGFCVLPCQNSGPISDCPINFSPTGTPGVLYEAGGITIDGNLHFSTENAVFLK